MNNIVTKLVMILGFPSLFFNSFLSKNESAIAIFNGSISPAFANNSQQELYEQIQRQGQKFSPYLQENGELLETLKEESKNSPNVINGDVLTSFSNEYEQLFSQLKSFQEQLPNEPTREVNNLIAQLETGSAEGNMSLQSVAELFADGQLNKPEICEQLQVPLGTVTEPNAPNCGLFNEETYTQLANFLAEQNQLINNIIDELAPLIVTESANSNLVESDGNNSRATAEASNSKLPLIVSSVAILLALISLGIAVINFLRLQKFIDSQNKNISIILESQEQDLESKVQNYHQQIDTFNRRLYDLKEKVDSHALLLKQLQSPHSNLNPNTDSRPASHNFNSPSAYHLRSTHDSSSSFSSPTPENIRLAQSYQQNPTSFVANATQVGMTKDTTNKILGGVWEQIYLEENRRTGEYFIVTSNSGEMYLFLNPHSMFNPQTLSTINKSQLFTCHGNLSQSRKGIDITIQKPAKVKKEAQYWVLVEPGDIILE
jgi:hypothetical protein